MKKLSLAAGLLAAAFMATAVAPVADAKPAKTITQQELKEMLNAPVVTVSVVSNYYNGGTLETKNFRNAADLREYLQTALDADNVIKLHGINGINVTEKSERNYSAALQDTRITKSAYAHFEINGNFKEGDSARLRGWDLKGVDLSRSHISNIDLTGVNLEGASFDGSDIENTMLAGIYAPKSSWKRVTFGENVKGSGCIEGVTTVLSQADFTGTPFKELNWGRAIMNGAILPALVQGTNLQGADLRGVDAASVRFEGTDIEYAQLEGANFIGATFHDVGTMTNNTFDENTNMAWAKFTGNSIPQLDLVQHKEAQERGLPSPKKAAAPAPAQHLH